MGIPVKMEMKGLWLLSQEDLESLDRLIDAEWVKLLDAKKADQKAAVKKARERAKELGRYDNKTTEERKELSKTIRVEVQKAQEWKGDFRRVEIHFKSGKRHVVERFEEALRDLTLQDEIPTRFASVIHCGEIEAKVELNGWFSRNQVTVDIAPDSSPPAIQFAETLRLWFRSKNGPKWQQLWVSWWGVAWVIVFVALQALPAIAKEPNPSERWMAEARELLHRGIQPKESQRATELILSILSGNSERSSAGSSGWVLVTFAAIFLMAIILTIRPCSTIAVGKGSAAIQRYQCWSRLVSYTIPVTVIFFGILMPFFREYLRDFWNR